MEEIPAEVWKVQARVERVVYRKDPVGGEKMEMTICKSAKKMFLSCREVKLLKLSNGVSISRLC